MLSQLTLLWQTTTQSLPNSWHEQRWRWVHKLETIPSSYCSIWYASHDGRFPRRMFHEGVYKPSQKLQHSSLHLHIKYAIVFPYPPGMGMNKKNLPWEEKPASWIKHCATTVEYHPREWSDAQVLQLDIPTHQVERLCYRFCVEVES